MAPNFVFFIVFVSLSSLKSLAEPHEWTPINPGDPEVVNLAKYGLVEENQRDSRSLKFVSIVRGQYVEIDDGRPEYVPIIRYKLVISADDEKNIRKQYEEILSESLEASVVLLDSFKELKN
ncbi:Cysteine proteinase inhibitor 4 [Striga hermonthica]|uniref:Cysteine proteinase inhibitor 4 n=1 Tax=Striga hermonthica TaxID=68872 RepID=A0A9N7RPV0_STRHE|nr:Cysteine proteinase inhibitor 4 [Striga hermonthica]